MKACTTTGVPAKFCTCVQCQPAIATEEGRTMRVMVDGVERIRPAFFQGLELLPEVRDGEQLVRVLGGPPYIVTVRR